MRVRVPGVFVSAIVNKTPEPAVFERVHGIVQPLEDLTVRVLLAAATFAVLMSIHSPAFVDGRSAGGSVEERAVTSNVLGRTRRVWVYTPPDYPRSCNAGCPVVVAFDGEDYQKDIPLPAILDSLTAAHKLAPTVALLIDNGSGAERIGDLGNRASFAAFVTDEVMPWLRAGWRVTKDPENTIIAGSSAGGLAAAFIAFRRPDLFGKVLSQSGAFWRGNDASNEAPYEWLTQQYESAPRKPVRFLLDVGSEESKGALGGAAPSILSATRHLHEVLQRKGYRVEYTEVAKGVHAPITWRPRLPLDLVALNAP